MLYPKNVPNPERILRIIAGVILVSVGLSAQSIIVVGLTVV